MGGDAGETLDAVLQEMAVIQQDLVDALARAAELVPKARGAVGDIVADLEDTPLEAILREMLASREQATADRTQMARMVILLDRLESATGANAKRLENLENAGAHVAANLAAQQERADAVTGEPGAAADAGMRSPEK